MALAHSGVLSTRCVSSSAGTSALANAQDGLEIIGGSDNTIGGTGEKKTLKLIAKYGDACNLFGDPATVRRSFTLSATDYVLTISERIARRFAEPLGLVTTPDHDQAEQLASAARPAAAHVAVGRQRLHRAASVARRLREHKPPARLVPSRSCPSA